jgi:hypothetical protein
MTTLETVVLGIVSSLIATFFFLGLSWIVKNAAIPWFEDKIYRGVRIDGRWILKVPGQTNGDSIGTIELVQKADCVSGTYTHEDDKSKKIVAYRFLGSIANAYLNAAITPVSKEMIDTGALVLHIYQEDSLRMSGVLTYISSKDGGVQSDNVVLARADS